MQKPCFRCEGEGFLVEFSHIKGGVCFTCGGDGVVETYPPRKTKEMDKMEYREFVSYMTTEDVQKTEFKNLDEEQRETIHKHMLDKANRMMKSGLFSSGEKKLVEGMKEPSEKNFETLRKEILPSMQKHLVDSIPRPYEDSPYFKKGVITMVPTAWAMKFQGNRLRYDVGTELLDSIVKGGLAEVPYFSIGQQDRHVKVGEGNHRMNVYHELGLDFIPMRVMRTQLGEESGSHAYDKMSRVPKNDYFKADASPAEVFDTFYDGGEYRDVVKAPEDTAKEAVLKLIQTYSDDDFLDDTDGENLVANLLALDQDKYFREYYEGLELLQRIERENGMSYSKGTSLDLSGDDDDFEDDFEDDDDDF